LRQFRRSGKSFIAGKAGSHTCEQVTEKTRLGAVFGSPDKRAARIRGIVAVEGWPRVRFAYPGYEF